MRIYATVLLAFFIGMSAFAGSAKADDLGWILSRIDHSGGKAAFRANIRAALDEAPEWVYGPMMGMSHGLFYIFKKETGDPNPFYRINSNDPAAFMTDFYYFRAQTHNAFCLGDIGNSWAAACGAQPRLCEEYTNIYMPWVVSSFQYQRSLRPKKKTAAKKPRSKSNAAGNEAQLMQTLREMRDAARDLQS